MKWSFTHASQKKATESTAGVIATITLALGLSVGCFDVTMAMLPTPFGLSSFPSVLTPLAVTTGIVCLVYVLLWFLVVSPLGRILKLQAFPLAVSLALFLGTTFLLVMLNKLIHFHSFLDNLFKLVLLLSLSFLTSSAAYLASNTLDRLTNYRNLVLIVSLAAPFVFGQTTVFIWLHKYRLGPFLSFVSLSATVGYVLIVLLTVTLMWRIGLRIRITNWLAVLVGLFILCSFGSWFGARVSYASLGEIKQTDHEIKRVFLITVDTLRADALSCYGNQSVSTPHIDQLARDGVLFEKAISPSPWTIPSLASIMTGLPPQAHMTIRAESKLPDKLRTLAEYMRDSGYLATALGSTPWGPTLQHVGQGFHELNFYPKMFGVSLGTTILRKAFPGRYDDISTANLTKLAIGWIETNQDKKFFLWIHYFDPHEPYEPPPNYVLSKNARPTTGMSFSDELRTRAGDHAPSFGRKEWYRHLYDAEVRYVDDSIGKLVKSLKRMNLYDESLIILTSDHGEEFMEHGGYRHGSTLYDELLWVPLVIKPPFSTSRRKVSTVVSTQRIMPTILDLCGIKLEESDYLSVSSLRPLWGSNPDTFEEKPIVSTGVIYRGNPWSEFYDERVSVIFDGLKYIHSLGSNREELYDLARDPNEQFSIVQSFPDKVEQARNILEAHSEMVRQLRENYGLQAEEQIKLDEETIERLKALGYAQ